MDSNFLPPRFFWSGNVTSSSFSLRVQAFKDDEKYVLVKDGDTANTNNQNVGEIKIFDKVKIDVVDGFGFIVKLYIWGLAPLTRYRVLVAGENMLLGSVMTFAPEGSAQSFSFVIASCDKWHSAASDTYAEMAASKPLFYISTGDLFYGDVKENDKAKFASNYVGVLEPKIQKQFFASFPVYYIYDDHDWSDNDSVGSANSREASLWAFQSFYPHPTLQPPAVDSSSIIGFQAFTVGRVRFVITDLRSASTLPESATSPTTLGEFQKQLLFQEFANFKNFQVLFWISTKPWSGAVDKADGAWRSYPDERTQIANKIAALGVDNLIMIAGDAHMLAFDDGSNTDYSTESNSSGSKGGAGFPLLQSAPVAQYGSVKGGKYTHGCFGFRFYPNYQYSQVEIADNGAGETTVSFKGRVVGAKDAVIDHSIKINRDGGVTWMKKSAATRVDATDCSLPLFPWWVWLLASLLLATLLMLAAAVFMCCRKKRHRNKSANSKNVAISSKKKLTMKG